ncbi:MAG: tyrosine-type recombinase/integrase [Gammaproteobacteria bacterium]|nr:tyrosine-type recombinase/integrase [Gammaproteobacteria bacterium]
MANPLETVAGRRRLEPRREPYWLPLSDITGAYVGFRRGPDTWVARLREDGRQHYHQLGKFEDHRAAMRAARQWIESRNQGVVHHDATVGDACRAYLSSLEAQKGTRAAQEARGRLQRGVLGRSIEEARKARARSLEPNPLVRKPLAKLRAADIEAWRDALVPDGLTGEARRKARATANREFSALIAVLNFAHRRQLVASDMAWAGVSKFSDVQARTARRFVTIEERKALLHAAKNVGGGKIADLLEALMFTGARPIELARATVGDFDKTSATLRLFSYKGRSPEPRNRDVPLRALGAEELIKRLCARKLPAAPIFTDDDGKPWAHSSWDDLVREAVKAAALKPFTAYDLRHSFITTALNGGVDPLTVSKIVGTSLQQISIAYGKLVGAHAAEAFANVKLR